MMDIYGICLIVENVLLISFGVYACLLCYLDRGERKKPAGDTGKLAGRQEADDYDSPGYW